MEQSGNQILRKFLRNTITYRPPYILPYSSWNQVEHTKTHRIELIAHHHCCVIFIFCLVQLGTTLVCARQCRRRIQYTTLLHVSITLKMTMKSFLVLFCWLFFLQFFLRWIWMIYQISAYKQTIWCSIVVFIFTHKNRELGENCKIYYAVCIEKITITVTQKMTMTNEKYRQISNWISIAFTDWAWKIFSILSVSVCCVWLRLYRRVSMTLCVL